MNEFQRVKSVSEKMRHLLETVNRNGGRFSAIEKDLLVGYMRELYELAVSIQPSTTTQSVNSVDHLPQNEMPSKPEEEKNHADENEEVQDGKNENISKKSITEIYAERNMNGKSSVNERFKKQLPEVADKLRQTPIKDLKGYIGLNKRFAFIEALFNDREEEYENVVSKVNGFKSYEEAVNYLRSEVLQKFEWSDDEPLVGEFFTLVMRRYLK